MKKTLSLILAVMMLASVLVITVNAQDPYGTIVEIPYSATAPSMDDAAPDESWGAPIIHIDKNSKNAGFTQYKHPDKEVPDVKHDLSFDLYAKWTDEAMYLCFTSPDPDMVGGPTWFSGDVFQLVVYPGVIDISYCNGVSTGWNEISQYSEFDWVLSLGPDDFSPDGSDKAIENGAVFVDEKNNQLIFKFK